jgi:hypothetical protein
MMYDELLEPIWSNSESNGDETVEENIPAGLQIPTNISPPID